MQHIIPPAFDSLVFAAVAREIQQDLLDGRITGLVQPDAYTVGLRLRTRRGTAGLLCSIHPRWARCVIAPLPEGRAVHPFAVQLRARLDGGRLRAAGLEPFERVLTLTCETRGGGGPGRRGPPGWGRPSRSARCWWRASSASPRRWPRTWRCAPDWIRKSPRRRRRQTPCSPQCVNWRRRSPARRSPRSGTG